MSVKFVKVVQLVKLWQLVGYFVGACKLDDFTFCFSLIELLDADLTPVKQVKGRYFRILSGLPSLIFRLIC